MARPARTDRTTVASTTLTIRITEDERRALDALVARRSAEVTDAGGQISAAGVVRALIRRAAADAGVLAPSGKAVARPRRK